MLQVSNFTVGDLRKVLEKFDDNVELIACMEDKTPLDISSVSLKSYNPFDKVQEDHMGPVLCCCLNLEVLEN